MRRVALALSLIFSDFVGRRLVGPTERSTNGAAGVDGNVFQ